MNHSVFSPIILSKTQTLSQSELLGDRTVHAMREQPSCYTLVICLFSIFNTTVRKDSICGAMTFFMWFILLSGVLWPRLLPPPHPLAISCHNARLCLCNEKQHSSGVMTSSVSTGVGTRGATLSKDWVAPTGSSGQNLLVVAQTLLFTFVWCCLGHAPRFQLTNHSPATGSWNQHKSIRINEESKWSLFSVYCVI